MIQGSERQCCLVFLPILAKTWPETTPLKTKHLFKTRFGLDTKIHHSVIWLDWVMFGEKLIIYIKFWVYERHHFLGGHILSPNSQIRSLKSGPFFSWFCPERPTETSLYLSVMWGVALDAASQPAMTTCTTSWHFLSVICDGNTCSKLPSPCSARLIGWLTSVRIE